MAFLSKQALAVLNVLLKHIDEKRVIAGDPRTYLGYGEVHEVLGLPKLRRTIGESLQAQGLQELAEWTLRENHPAITGLVVGKTPDDGSYLVPGHGFFELFRKQENYEWWRHEVERSLAYPWDRFLGDVSPPPTPEAVDLSPSTAARVEIVEYRILRDTQKGRRVKALYNHECQICGRTITLRNGMRYAEAHHIQPLGDDGPDVIENILCLCPNHHAELDYAAVSLSVTMLKSIVGHAVGERYIAHHNQRYVESGKVVRPRPETHTLNERL